MSKPTINLNDGLQCLYYFDEQNFDNQRNQIRDHSGYARHAEASGGPTIGVEGPNDFGATSFDGSDDYFQTEIVADDFTPTASLTFLSKQNVRGPDAGNAQIHLTTEPGNNNDDWGILENKFNYGLVFDDYNGDPNLSLGDPSEFAVYTLNFDSAGIRAYRNGQLVGERSTQLSVSTPSQALYVGDTGEPLDGSMSFVAVWNRTLNRGEIEHLASMTAPRRSQL